MSTPSPHTALPEAARDDRPEVRGHQPKFAGALTGEQWANIAVTAVVWLVIPPAVGLRFVTRVEAK